jgi:hypothetical protein
MANKQYSGNTSLLTHNSLTSISILELTAADEKDSSLLLVFLSADLVSQELRIRVSGPSRKKRIDSDSDFSTQ